MSYLKAFRLFNKKKVSIQSWTWWCRPIIPPLKEAEPGGFQFKSCLVNLARYVSKLK